MAHRGVRKLALYSLMALLSTAATCPPTQSPVTVKYDQVGACNGYQQTSGPGGAGPANTISAGPNAAFVVFRVVTLDNSKSAMPFNFDPERMFLTGSSPREHVSTSLSLARDIGVFAATAVTVPARMNQGNNGIAVMRVSTAAANGASEANNTNYLLTYDSAAGESVFLDKRNATQGVFPQTDDCRGIRF
jgi:hypothetical protein